MTRIAITGAKGTVGTALSERLSLDHEIIPIDLPEIDVLDSTKLVSAVKGAKVVIHLAGRWGSADREGESWRSKFKDPYNRQIFNAVLQAALDANVQQFIHASSIHVEHTMEFAKNGSGLLKPEHGRFATETPSGYGRAKREQEEAVRAAASLFPNGAVSLRLGGVTPDNMPVTEHSNPDIVWHEQKVWLAHDDLAQLVEQIIAQPHPAFYDIVYAVSDNNGRIHDTSNGFGWVPQASSQDHL